MSDKEKIITSLENKGLLDELSVKRLRERLRQKLKTEAHEQEKKILSLRSELITLQSRISS